MKFINMHFTSIIYIIHHFKMRYYQLRGKTLTEKCQSFRAVWVDDGFTIQRTKTICNDIRKKLGQNAHGAAEQWHRRKDGST
jgi:hypothetical protein